MPSQLPHLLESALLAILHPRATYLRVSASLDLRLCVRLENMRRAGLFKEITHVLDAGANVGAFSCACARMIPSAEIISFEPTPLTFKTLVSATKGYSEIKPVNLALGGARSTLPMNVGEFHVANSLLRMNSNHQENWPGSEPSDVVMVSVIPLDEFLEQEKIRGNYLIKADVQRYELELLKGAKESLKRCHLLQLEVSLVALYEGAPSVSELWSYVSAAGFSLFDIVDILYSPINGAALSCDLIFIRQ